MDKLEGNESLISYCGLYCGDCHGYQQKIQDFARYLRKELRQTKYKKFADFMAQQSFSKAFENYDKCYEVLGAMAAALEADHHSVKCGSAVRRRARQNLSRASATGR